MQLVSTRQIPVAHLTWRSRRGELTHTIMCKATYALQPLESALAGDQEPIHESDQHWEDSPKRSLRVASDLAPFKRRADVVVVGAVFAPRGTTSHRVIARIAVGAIDKSLVALSDRAVGRDGVLVEGRPFSRMPLVYERARGGEETDNPVGRTSARDAVGNLQLPNFQPVAFEPVAPEFLVPSIGLGPIASSWPSRTRCLGGHASSALESVLGRPEELDASFFNVAPSDQQLGDLSTDAHLLLESLNAEHARLVTRLPGHRARALVERTGVDIPLVCDTLWIDTERAIATLTWRGSFRADDLLPSDRIIVSLEGADLTRHEEGHPRKAVSGEETQTLTPRDASANAEAPALPFASAAEPRATIAASHAGTPFQAPTVPPAPVLVVAPPSVVPGPAFAPPREPSFVSSAPQAIPSPLAQSFPPQPAPSPLAQAFPIAAAQISAPVSHDPRAAFRGVASASNAAARSDLSPKPVASESHGSLPQAATRSRTLIDLSWFDPTVVERVRARPSWTEQLDTANKKSAWLSQRHAGEAGLRDRVPSTCVSRAMVRGPVHDAAGVQEAIAGAYDEEGFLLRPLVVVEGELSLFYSPIEALKTHIALAEPLGSTDKKLKDQLDVASEIVRAERRSTPPMIEAALARVRAAFHAANKVYPASYLETTTERVLTDERSYLKRIVLGGPKLVASLTPATGGALTVYLPEDVEYQLPLLARFRVRLIAEPHPRQETSDEATVLLALALGRVSQPPH